MNRYPALATARPRYMVQAAEVARRYDELRTKAVESGFEFANDALLVPPLDKQTPAQKEFLKQFLGL